MRAISLEPLTYIDCARIWSRPCEPEYSYLDQYFWILDWMQCSTDAESHAQFNEPIGLGVLVVLRRVHFLFLHEKSQQKQQQQMNFSIYLAEQSELRLWLLRAIFFFFFSLSSAARVWHLAWGETVAFVANVNEPADIDATVWRIAKTSANSNRFIGIIFRCSRICHRAIEI